MSQSKKSVVERLAVINGHALRRQILQDAREAHAQGRLISPIGLHKQLKAPIGGVSYHVTVLRNEGVLRLQELIPRRGAHEHLYGINEDFLAEIQDSVALDQIAESLEEPQNETIKGRLGWLVEIVRSTGRPVEA
jgi:hypothetical protein